MLAATPLRYGQQAGWLTDSFQQFSVAWLLLSALVGAVVGATTKFFFEDVLRPRLGLRREARRLLADFTTPLMRSANTLERQINNVVRNADENWYTTSDYYRLSTLFTFAEYLAWVKLIERRFGFVFVEHSRAGRRLDERLHGFFGAMSSFRYFRWCEDRSAVESSAVPRRMFTAMGEVMLVPASDRTATVMEFSTFCLRYESDAQFRRWFQELDQFLRCMTQDPLRWDRLIVAGANLRALVNEIDPDGRVGGTVELANLDRLRSRQVKEAVSDEFDHLLPHRGTRAGVASPLGDARKPAAP